TGGGGGTVTSRNGLGGPGGDGGSGSINGHGGAGGAGGHSAQGPDGNAGVGAAPYPHLTLATGFPAYIPVAAASLKNE
ncbi:PE family protein, partial [Mycobacterium tuberculosis]|nr:PE family protein [Mycobacterium tuberculosis]